MKARPRVKLIAACVGTALAQWGAGSAIADSAVGVDTALGNALNPPGRSAVPRPLAAESMDTVRRSPTGQLYGIPYDRSDEGHNHTDSGWEYSGGVEGGYLGGDPGRKNALFRKYKDLKSGPYLDYFEAQAYKPGDANYFQAFGGGVGRKDQFYGVQVGRYNDWRVRLFYNEIIHVFTDSWKSLHDGEGTGNLTTGLPSPTLVTTALPVGTVGGAATALGTYVGPPITSANNCSAAAPCWSYGGRIYQNGVALAAINGITGTANATSGVMPTSGTTPQSGMALAISDKLAATQNSELSLTRKKGGIRADLTLDNFWKGYASYSNEERKGARPFAMNEGNLSFEVAEPIDYTTHEFLTGLSYADSLTQANLRASLSMFRNNISTLNVQHPMLMSQLPIGALGTATYDLYPNNDAFNLKGEFARNLPDFYKGRFTAALSWGSNRQDDDLLAPISSAQNANLSDAGVTAFGGSTNTGYATGSSSVANWNTVNALSQKTAKQRIDNKLLELKLSLRPTDKLSTNVFTRYYETDNKGGYMAYNPLTGQFGRGVADGNNANMDAIVGLQPGATPVTAGSCYTPPGYPAVPGCTFGLPAANGANVPVFGQARSTKQLNYGLSGDYDLTRVSSVNAQLEREEFKRNFREREKTWEDKLKLGYVNRGLETVTMRFSYETDRKRGGEYRYRTFEDLGTGLPGLDPATQIAALNAGTTGYAALNANLFSRYSYYFRKYDQADRNQDILNARFNLMPRDDLDLGITAQFRDVKYPDSVYGLEKDKQNSLTVDINYQPSMNNIFFAYYSYQEGKKSMDMNSGQASLPNTACTLANLALYGYVACSDGISPTNGARPASSRWTSNTRDRNDVYGVGGQTEIGRTRLSFDYSYATGTTEISYLYGGSAITNVVANQATLAAIAGTALPSMKFTQQVLTLNLMIPIDKRLAVRLFDRYEAGTVKDWHYDGVITGAVANYDSGTLLLDAGPQNYHVNVIGAYIQYKL
jgi:hypothetical protein